MDVTFFYLTLSCYFIATLGYVAHLMLMKKILWKVSRMFLATGVAAQTMSIIMRAAASGHTPVTNRYEALMAFSWLLVVLYLLIQSRRTMPTLGAFLSPIALILLLLASVQSKEIRPLDAALNSRWFPVHIWFAFLGDAMLGLSACFAGMYLIQEYQLKHKKINLFYYRLPPLDVLDQWSYRCISFGFPFLSLGILSGAIWLKTLQGTYVDWQDGRQAAVLLTWFIYASLLHGRLVVGWRGRHVAWLNIAGFTVTLGTFLWLSHFMT